GSRSPLSGQMMALLALVRCNRRLRRAFRCRLHAGRALTLRALRGRPTEPGFEGAGPALRLLLTRRLRHLLATGAVAWFGDRFVFGPYWLRHDATATRYAKCTIYNAHGSLFLEHVA